MAFIESLSKADMILQREEIIADKKKPLEIRKQAYRENMDAALNPSKNFDPATFDPFEEDPDIDVKRRSRVQPPARLPTKGMFPKELLDGQMIGMFESKQDLYLIMAHYINLLLDEVDELKSKIGNNV